MSPRAVRGRSRTASNVVGAAPYGKGTVSFKPGDPNARSSRHSNPSPNDRSEPSAEDRIAFVLSFALPGAGQIWKGSATGLGWLASTALLVMFWELVAENASARWPVVQYGSFIGLSLASAWRAYRFRAARRVHANEDD